MVFSGHNQVEIKVNPLKALFRENRILFSIFILTKIPLKNRFCNEGRREMKFMGLKTPTNWKKSRLYDNFISSSVLI